MDPATGKMVTAPEYGGTLTYPYVLDGETTDPFVTGSYAGMLIGNVNEKLARPNWRLPRSLSESWSRDYEVSEPRGPPRRPPGSVAHSRVPKQGLREGLRLFGRDHDASNTLQRVSGARSGATARPPGRTDPTYPPARAYSRFRFHAVHTRLHSPSAPRNPRR